MRIYQLTANNQGKPKRVGNPVIPPSQKDPVKQSGNLRNANAKLNKRYKNIKRGVRNLIAQFEPERIVTNAVRYEYQLDANRYQQINLYLQQLLYEQLLDNQQGIWTQRWWLNGNLNFAYERGTADALQSAKNIAVVPVVGPEISQQVRSIELEQVLFSPQYQRRVGMVYARTFELMKGISDDTKTDLADTLARGMAAGHGIKRLTKDTMARVDVSQSRAKRIVRTEITGAYRRATRDETKDINENIYDDSDWGMELLWFSALAETSRPNHVARHGSVYDDEEVTEFYSTAANAISCLCSQSPVLVNKKTGELLQKDLQKRLQKQKKDYQKTH